MADIKKAFLVIGKIGSPYGVKGWLKIQSYAEFGPTIIDYRPWYIATATGEWQIQEIEDSRTHHNGVVAKFPGVESPEEARLLTGRTIGIARSQLPELPKDEYYWSDLEGLNVINKDGTNLGIVMYLIATGANDVLVVKGEKEHAIPYLRGTVVKNIDLIKKEILVDWEVI